ncbi:MAG: hypothetical protein HY017_16760 [Betaproteobacteria bacterium]|nr:hypothetical protein [Betaproteobacteria bacterium]
MPETPDPRAFDDEIFAYAAGELDAAARARVEARLAADPALRARLSWYEAVCERVIEAAPPLRDLPSADVIIERIRGNRRKRGFFAWLGGPALKPAAALATLLIVIQGLVVAMLAGERSDTAATRSAAPARGVVVLVVAFNPEAKESGIRALLLEAGATIVGGPKQLGEYRLQVPMNRAEFAQSLFGQSKLVEYVRVEER